MPISIVLVALLSVLLKESIVNIVFTFITGAGCIKSMLMENNKLQCLYISSNKIGDDGVRLITEGLQYNNTLIKLDAYRCDFSIEGR